MIVHNNFVPSSRRILNCIFAALAAGAASTTHTTPATAPASAPAPGTVAWVPVYKTLATISNIKIENGGFGSAIARDPRAANSFYLLTDRGPNFDVPGKNKKGFAAASFTPSIARVEITNDAAVIKEVIELKDKKKRPLSGRPNPGAAGGRESAVGPDGKPIDDDRAGLDSAGLDSEGLAAMNDGTFWVSDEYGPFLMHFDARGVLLEKAGPAGSAPDLDRELPRVFGRRRPNRGFEGLTKTPDEAFLVAMLQSAPDNPDAGVRDASRTTRILMINLKSWEMKQYLYAFDTAKHTIGDLAAISNSKFLVIERDSKTPGDPLDPSKFKKIMLADVSKCNNSLGDPAAAQGLLEDGKTLEQCPLELLRAKGFVAEKSPVLDLLEQKYPHEKPEGICIINETTIAISNDDDFGIQGDGRGGIEEKTPPLLGGRRDAVSMRFYAINAGAESALPLRQDIKKQFALADFYKKSLLIGDFPVVASEKVPDAALREAANIVENMIGPRREIFRALAAANVRLTVMHYKEMTTDVPEHADLTPKDYWDKRARGLGATAARPSVSCSEENLLNYPGDPYWSENILVHEFSHAVHEMAMPSIDPSFDGRLEECYKNAMAASRWKGTYAATNKGEYWAEVAQSWFDTNRQNDSEHNDIATRDKIKLYDPDICKLLIEVYGDRPWRYKKASARRDEDHLKTVPWDRLPKFEWPTRLKKQ
ncbi:MAG: esterase-like activity of phytase family protein [Planctomycetes bacterium]|nr:esterase-like activity of phytase family protein [Planctomycetota bacterium]